MRNALAELVEGRREQELRRRSENRVDGLVGDAEQPEDGRQRHREHRQDRHAPQSQREPARLIRCRRRAGSSKAMKTAAMARMQTTDHCADRRSGADVEELQPLFDAVNISVSVASPGPPLVVTKMMSKTRKASIVRKSARADAAGSNSGRTMLAEPLQGAPRPPPPPRE